MKIKYLYFSIMIMVCFFLVTGCDFTGYHRYWSGSCLTTLTNGGVDQDYHGLVEFFHFENGVGCTLIIRDDFLSGYPTVKTYEGNYSYEEDDHLLGYTLTLKTINDIPVDSAMEYNLSNLPDFDYFDLESDYGNLSGTLSEGDLELSSAVVTVSFNLKAD